MISVSRLSIAIYLICVFIIFTMFLHKYVGVFSVEFKPNSVVIKTKAMIFDEYLKKFNKSYSGDEYSKRLSYFMVSLKEISRLNLISGAIHGPTKFSDMTKEEFSKMMIRPRYRPSKIQQNMIHEKCLTNIPDVTFNFTDNLPIVVDWRREGAVGPVLDQGKCGSCWAFNVIGLMESMSIIQGIEQTYLRRSIQELLDCNTYKMGCNGGEVAKALEYLCTYNIPITTEEQYPLTLINNSCLQQITEGRRIREYWINFNLDETKLQYFLAKHGPLAVVVNADPMMNYIGGIIQRACYRSKDHLTLDHVVQLVGYDKSGSVPYYIARNSWGDKFGDDGYVKLMMDENICGVSDEVSLLDVY